jgi:reactive intermediate/imine deaminase
MVRSGKEPEKASAFMSDTVIANQMNAELPETIKRTPGDYAEHIRDFIRLYGHYDFEITELIAQDDKVYARWKQTGRHLADIDDYKATGLPLTEIASAVYRVENRKIAEYWIQVDREGFDRQLQQNEKTKSIGQKTKPSFTPFVASAGMIYISGQIGTDPVTGKLVNGSFEAEVNQVMKNLGAILQKNNLDYHDLVNVTIYLTTMDHYAVTNEVYLKYFNDILPARVCIAVKELPMKANIEIAAIAKQHTN